MRLQKSLSLSLANKKNPGGRSIKGKFILILIALGVLYAPAFGQMTAENWCSVGSTLFNQGKYEESIQAYNKSIKLNPQYALAWFNKGTALGQLGKYDEEIQACDKAIQLDPQYAEAWYNKGTAQDKQGKYDAAIQAFDKAIEINPQYADAWNGKGNALFSQGKNNESTLAHNKAIELDPKLATSYTLNHKGPLIEPNDFRWQIHPGYAPRYSNNDFQPEQTYFPEGGRMETPSMASESAQAGYIEY